MRILPALALVAALASAAVVQAAEIRVMSAGAVEPGLAAAARKFQERTGHTVTVRYGTGPQLQARLGVGEIADLLVSPRPVMQAAQAAGRITGEPVAIGRVGVGVVVRRGAPKPDISSADALKRALQAAKAIVYNKASTGAHVDAVLKRAGLAQALAARTVRPDDGEGVLNRLAQGSGAEIGFGAITEIRQAEPSRVELVGPAPGEFQNFTPYLAAPFAGAAPETAAFLGFLASGDGRAALASGGVE